NKNYIRLDKILCTISYLFFIIPILILLTFWFKWYISLPCSILLIISFVLCIKKFKPKTNEEYTKIFNIKKIVIFIFIIIIINILSGSGGITFQNWDYKFRNTVLQDLIQKDWPVKYDYSNLEYEASKIKSDEGILSYYFTFWLPGAAIGKIFGFKIASLFMFFWQTLGVTLFFYLLIRYLNKIKLKYILVFLSIGGLDIISRLILNYITNSQFELIGTVHIDTSNSLFVMSSFLTQLFWVFNQSVTTWIIIMLLLNEKKYENIGVMIALLLPFAPFPTIGLIIYSFIIIIFGFELNKKPSFSRITKCFSLQNISAVLSVIPIGLMFLQNSSQKGFVFLREYNNGNIKYFIIFYIMFLILEFGIYAVIINKDNWKRIITYFILFSLIPLIYIGNGLDFSNRVTIPILVLLYIDVLIFIDKKGYKIRKAFLCIILIIAFTTNFNEIYRSIKYTKINYQKGISLNFNDVYKTFSIFENKECDGLITNFVSPVKDTFLFNYIIK
ncbi:MAG: hypothetical protein RSC92_05715, partial [Clostridia bacterium]